MSRCRYDCQEIAKALHNADIVTVGDLLMVAPRRYYHWGRLTPLSSLREGEDVTILAEVAGAHLVANRSGSGVRLEVSLTEASSICRRRSSRRVNSS